jgi:hypothetical protein
MCRVFTAASTQEDVFLREGTIALERVMAVCTNTTHDTKLAHLSRTQLSLMSLAHKFCVVYRARQKLKASHFVDCFCRNDG